MEETRKSNISDHLANERTFLAWIRTGIGIMAFGFVVVKFSLFVKQLALVLSKPPATMNKGYSNIVGISLVVAGALAIVFSWTRYRHTKRQIDEETYRDSSLLISFITIFILIISVLLIGYLVQSI